ncbi:MAG TPA: hypothetical protein DEB39_00320 [Planctomycetaceae bacterium]|nr:hypothetical protein [Planctomycetaceae bacterium]
MRGQDYAQPLFLIGRDFHFQSRVRIWQKDDLSLDDGIHNARSIHTVADLHCYAPGLHTFKMDWGGTAKNGPPPP